MSDHAETLSKLLSRRDLDGERLLATLVRLGEASLLTVDEFWDVLEKLAGD